MSSQSTNTLIDSNRVAQSFYDAPDGTGVTRITNLQSPPFMDDFGGTSISATNWNILSGGLAAAPVTLNGKTLNNGQAAIGSGTNVGITAAVASSALTVTMGTTNGDEYWLLSQQTFAAAENITLNIMRSQNLVANDVFVGLVEVDPATGIPLANPNLANYFTNMGGANFGLVATTTGLIGQAIGDSSSLIAQPTAVAMIGLLTTAYEYEIEIASEDIQISQLTPDSAVSRSLTVIRVSTQCPNDAKVYKLLLRFRNVATPGSSTTYTIQRIIVDCKDSMRVTVDSGNGDIIGSKAVPVNVCPGGSIVGYIYLTAAATGNPIYLTHKLFAAATTNATSVKTTAAKLIGGVLCNQSATTKYYVHLYNLASAPTVGTSTVIQTIALLPGATITLADYINVYGFNFSLGIAYSITGGYADTDTTAVTSAGDVIVNLLYL